MAQVEIMIGGRAFDVACQDGQEDYLITAAQLLDAEATSLTDQIGRLPEVKMVLMSGLMMADRVVALQNEIKGLKAEMRELERQAQKEPQKVEVPMIPKALVETMAGLAAEAEAMAQTLEERAGEIADQRA